MARSYTQGRQLGYLIGLRIGSLLVAGMINFSASAQTALSLQQELDTCLETYPAKAGLTYCIQDHHRKWDLKLSQTLDLLMNALSQDEKVKLNAAHRTWERYKEQEITKIRSLYRATPDRRWEVTQLETKIIKDRVNELQSYLCNPKLEAYVQSVDGTLCD